MAEVMENGMRYASNAKGNTGVALGSAALGVGLLGSHLGGLFGNFYNNGNGYVSKETFELAQKNSSLESELALVKADQASEVKIADVYARNAAAILELERAQNAKWTEQLVWNARMDSRMAVAESKIGQLMGMTGLYVEASKVTPTPMNRYNSWEAPTT